MPTPPYRPARVFFSVPIAAPDGRYYPRYPQGNVPAGLSGAAAVTIAAAAALTTAGAVAGAAVVTTAASGTLPSSAGGPQWQGPSFTYNLTVGTPFSLNLDTICSDPIPPTYSLISLPAGLTQSGNRNQTISGTPTAAGTTTVTETADDGSAVAGAATEISVATGALTTSGGTTAAADWSARIGGPGVVWYHAFGNQAEVDLFRWAGGIGNDPNATDADASKIFLEVGTGPGGFNCIAQSRPAGTHDTNSTWWRPFSAFTGATNGRGVDDPAAAGLGAVGPAGSVVKQAWAPQGNVNETAQWGKGWYTQNGAIQQDGTDFFVQVRIKMDPNASAAGMNSPCKLLELGILTNTFTSANLVTYLNGAHIAGGPNYHRLYMDFNVAPLESDDTLHRPGQQVGSDLANYPANIYCDVGTQPGNCWAWSGGWDTVLYHITPGSVDGTTTPSRIQVYAAHQGTLTYTKIWDLLVLSGWQASGEEGWNGFYLPSNYSNGFNQPQPVTSRYAQPIFSKQMIPCPQV